MDARSTIQMLKDAAKYIVDGVRAPGFAVQCADRAGYLEGLLAEHGNPQSLVCANRLFGMRLMNDPPASPTTETGGSGGAPRTGGEP